GCTPPRPAVYPSRAAGGLVAGLAIGRVEPVALAAPFVLALVAAAAAREPRVSLRLSLDRDRALEGDEVTATIELSSTGRVDRFELLLPLPEELNAADGTSCALPLLAGAERGTELKLRCGRWG